MAQDPKRVYLYDTTLRDGTQQRGISLSVEDKLRCTELLDAFGFDYIEGGWPGSNPKDEEYFRRLTELRLQHAKVAAFGSTRRKDIAVESDAQVKTLLDAATPVVTLVGKASVFHVRELLRTSLEENLRMIADTVSYCKAAGREVVFDAEHFFDGYALDPAYAEACLEAAVEAGADVVVLCDTNGGSLPLEVQKIAAAQVAKTARACVGIHAHNDAGVAVANSLLAVQAGARHVQGTINGYGERCGNANLISIIPALQEKMGYHLHPKLTLEKLCRLSRQVAELVNENHSAAQPYVGRSAFAHKGGLHVAAVERIPESYEHIAPSKVGNEREIVISELSGRGTVRMLARDSGVEVSSIERDVLALIKEREHLGYAYESAEGSVELLMRRMAVDYTSPFRLLETSVVSRSGEEVQAAVKLEVKGVLAHTVADGSGPVHALDLAVRKALLPEFPGLAEVQLSNYKVRILNPRQATQAKTRVMIEANDGSVTWVTVGCSDNIIDASCEALLDSYELFLARLAVSVVPHQDVELRNAV